MREVGAEGAVTEVHRTTSSLHLAHAHRPRIQERTTSNVGPRTSRVMARGSLSRVADPVTFRVTGQSTCHVREIANHEANISAESSEATPEARLSRTNEDARGACRPQATTRQGAEAPGRLRRLKVVVSPSTGRFRRSDRLLASRDYQRVSKSGRRTACPEFVLLIAQRAPHLAADPDAPRLGIAASRKVGNAIVRNRVKRSVREWFRAHRNGLPRGADVVVIARKPSASLGGNELIEALTDVARRAGAGS